MPDIPNSDLEVTASNVVITNEALIVELANGRTISVPLDWYPRLLHATPAERGNWRLINDHSAIRWADLDEAVSIQSLVMGRPSPESQNSFQEWLAGRTARSGHISTIP